MKTITKEKYDSDFVMAIEEYHYNGITYEIVSLVTGYCIYEICAKNDNMPYFSSLKYAREYVENRIAEMQDNEPECDGDIDCMDVYKYFTENE